MASMSGYNGWPGIVREARGKKFYAQLRLKNSPIPKLSQCDLCGSQGPGLTYHAEEYGSTWEDYVKSTHAVCPYCHGMIHMRFQFPNRWLRFRSRLNPFGPADLPLKFKDLGHFFNEASKLNDIPADQVPEQNNCGIDWVDALPLTAYKGPPKIATVMSPLKILRPDHTCYTMQEPVKGVVYDATTGKMTPFEWQPDNWPKQGELSV